MPWTSTHFSIWHAEGGSNRDAYNVVQIACTLSLTFWLKICHQGIEQGLESGISPLTLDHHKPMPGL